MILEQVFYLNDNEDKVGFNREKEIKNFDVMREYKRREEIKAKELKDKEIERRLEKKKYRERLNTAKQLLSASRESFNEQITYAIKIAKKMIKQKKNK